MLLTCSRLIKRLGYNRTSGQGQPGKGTWKTMAANELDARWLVFVDVTGANTSCVAVVDSIIRSAFEAYVEELLSAAIELGRVRGDGQPLRRQGRAGARVDRGKGLRASLHAALLARPQMR